MTAPIPPFPVAALAGIWLAGQRGGGDERTEHGMSDDTRSHPGYCYPDCGCPESAQFDWDGFADAINEADL